MTPEIGPGVVFIPYRLAGSKIAQQDTSAAVLV